MAKLTWALVVVVVIVLSAIEVMYFRTDDAAIQGTLLGYIDSIIPFVIGLVASGLAGWTLARHIKGGGRPGLLTDLTWPAVAVIFVVVAFIVVTFWRTDDTNLQKQLVGYFDAVIPFIVGASAGGAFGTLAGFK